MTRRIPVLQLAAPPSLLASVVAAFPGTVLVVDRAGEVTEAWAGTGAPVPATTGQTLHRALGLGDDDLAAGALTLWLACAMGVDAELFQLTAGDPPHQLPAALGRPALMLDYGPLFGLDGLTSGAVVFVRVAAATTLARVEAEPASPAQVERFLVESQALLDDCAAELTKIERDPEARASVARMFRAIHTLKGAARGAGLGPIAALAHQLEDTLDVLRQPGHVPSADELALARRLLGEVAAQVDRDVPHDAAIDAMPALYAGYRPLMVRAEAALAAWQARPRDHGLADAYARALARLRDAIAPFALAGPRRRVEAVAALVAEITATARPARRLLAGLDLAMAALHDQCEVYRDVYRELRASDRADELVRELAAVRRGSVSGIRVVADSNGLAALAGAARRLGDAQALAELIDDLPRMLAPAAAALGPRTTLAASQRLIDEAAAAVHQVALDLVDDRPGAAVKLSEAVQTLRGASTRLTWVPFDELGRRVRRLATSLAVELGKRVEVEIEAFGVIMPEPIHRRLGDMLGHAVRNALDHGIEEPERRVAQGKGSTGAIQVRVHVDDDAVEAAVIDDGAGVDLERVRQLAISRGLITTRTELDEHGLHELVFHPGLSTASAVTQVSGRGVGMDAIRALAEEAGGTAILTSHRGRGATLTIRMPLVPPTSTVALPVLNALG